MTVLAYRAGVLASDSMIADSNTRCGAMRKLARGPGGAVAGSCGACGVSNRFLRWVENGEPGEFEPGTESFNALIARVDGEVFRMDSDGAWWPVVAPYHAEGSGASVAMGAMEMGATAEQAVMAAIRWNLFCGGDVQVERLVCNERRKVRARVVG